MAINKNFVVKNGIEVNTNLIVADTDSNKVGIGTTVPEYTLHVFEGTGIGASTINVTGVGTFLEELNVGLAGTTLTVLSNITSGIGGSVGVGTELPAYLVDIRSPVSTGQTALYVQGDMRVTGDINIDDISIGDINVSGISTFVGNVIIGTAATVGFGSTAFFKDHAKAIFGDGEDLKVYHDGSNSYISDTGTGGLIVGSNSLTVKNAALNETQAVFTENGAVELYYDNGKRFETNAIGVEVSGTFESTGITTLASDAGITTTGGDLYVGGDLYINEDVILDTNLTILGIATIGVLQVSSTSGINTISSTVQSTSKDTGSLVLEGGLGVEKSVFVGDTLQVTGIATFLGGSIDINNAVRHFGDPDTHVSFPSADEVQIQTGGTPRLTIGSGGISTFSGVIDSNDTTQSTSATTGSAKFAGGVGIEKQLYVGAGASVGAGLTVKGDILPEADGTRDLGSSGAEFKDLYIDGTANIDSLSADTAAIGDLTTDRIVIVGTSGELEDSADLTFDGDTLAVNAIFDSNDATQSTSATTGSAQFAGGVGIEKQLYVGAGASVGAGFTIGTGIGVTTILDDDTFTNASAGALASQQSIKAYVDAQVTAADLDFGGDSGTGAVDLDSQTFTISGTANEIETSASSQTLTIGLPNFVTVSNGLNVTGNGSTTTTLNVTGISTFQSHVHLGNDDELRFGAKVGGDLVIVHDGDHGTIDNNDGNLNIKSEGNIEFNPNNTADGLRIINQGAVEVFHNSQKKFETTGAGVTVTGVTTSRGFVLAEDDGIHFRTTAADDLDAILRENSSNTLLINSRNDAIINIDSNNDGTDAHFAIGHNAATGSSTELFRVQENGNVGIGSDDPQNALDVSGDVKIVDNSPRVLFHDANADNNISATGGIEIFDKTGSRGAYMGATEGSNELTFGISPTAGAAPVEILRIDADGKVGINTNDPQGTLQVNDGLNGLEFNVNSNNAVVAYNRTTSSYLPVGLQGSSVQLRIGGTGTILDVEAGGTITTGIATFSSTKHLTVPVGTTAQRDSIVANGMIRYNTDLNSYEGYGNGAWGGLGGGTEIDVSVSSTSATNLTTFAHASYRSASFRVQITQGTSYQVGKYMLIHDGTTVTMVEESAIATGSMLGDITSVINGSNVEIKVTMYSASSATVTTIIDKITV